MHCVHKDEFLDHRAETAEMFHSINELKIFKTKIEQNYIDSHYVEVKNTHLIDEMTATMEKLKLDCEKALKISNLKLDIETFDEEIANILDHMQKSIRNPPDYGQSQVTADNGPTTLQKPKAMPPRGGGMSVAEKSKLKELAEGFVNIGTT